MKTFLPVIPLLFFSAFSFCQSREWAGGLRLIDPSGITVQKKFEEDMAFVVSFGKYFNFGRYNYGKDIAALPKFNISTVYNPNKYKLDNSWSIHGLILKYTSLLHSEKFAFYYAYGLQYRYIRVLYYYDIAQVDPISKVTYTDRNTDYLTGSDFGIQGLAGIEWFSQKKPYSLFLDFDMYIQVSPEIKLWPQAGLGIKYWM